MRNSLLLLALLPMQFLLAQGPGSQQPKSPGVLAKIVDPDNHPLPYATLALYTLPDTTLVNGNTSNEQGMVFVEAQPGAYIGKVTFLTFKPTWTDVFNVPAQGVARLGQITMQPDTKSLEEVVVAEERSDMQLQLDKRVYNVAKDPVNVGKNAQEILDNIPSVTVDVEGNVALRGSQNVRILIDGKPSGMMMSGPDALRQLQGSQIESIEVITNPSARYDAEGEVGIINIVLKKDKAKGLNGSLDANTGWPHRHGIGLNVNYRKNWFNLFGSAGVNYRKSPGTGYSYSEFNLPDTSFAYERIRERTRGGLGTNFRLGADFYLNEHNTITASASYDYDNDNNSSTLTYRDLDGQGNLLQEVIRTEDENELEHDIEMNLNYRKTFPQKDREWTIALQQIVRDDTELADLEESVQGSLGEGTLQRSSNTEDQRNWLFQTDYVHPFHEKGKFETGGKATLRVIDNDYSVEEEQSNGEWEPLPGFNSRFLYYENIYAAYVMAGDQFGKWQIQLGLRSEYSDITTEIRDIDSVNSRKYIGFFPSANVNYQFSDNSTLQLSYSRRINRPWFRALLPFFGFSDSRNLFSGNPNLQPEYTHSMEAGYLRTFDKGSVLGSVYYRYRTQVTERITTVDSITGITRILPVNLAEENNFGLEFNFNYRPYRWWTLNVNGNFYRAITEGSYEGQDLSRDTYTWSTRGMTRFTVWKKLDLQGTFMYRGPQETTQGRSKGLYGIDLAASKDILKGNGTITLSVRDLLNSHKWRWITDTPEYYSENEFQWHSRQITLNFNYRLNQKKQRGRNGQNGGQMENMDDMGM